MKIKINFLTLSPLLVITPASASKLSTDKRIVYGDGADGFPLTETCKLAQFIDGKRIFVPVVPCNTLRGALRRCAARLIEDSLLARGQTLTMAAVQGLEAGAVHGHPDGGDPTISQYQAESSDPYMGLFGGGPRMHSSRFALGDAIALTREMHDLEMLPSARECIDYRFIRRSDNALGIGVEQLLDDVSGAAEAWQTIFKMSASAKSEAKASDEGMLRGLNALTAMEFIIPGITLAAQGSFPPTATPAQVGLWLLSVMELCRKNQIGAAGRYNFGRFAADITLSSISVIEYVEGLPTFTAQLMKEFGSSIAAAQTYLMTVESATIESLFASSEAAVDALMAKCKTPAAKAALTLILHGAKKGKK